MLLVGMLDSPYVRRAAITGTLLEVSFEHRSVSVFRHMEEFRAINPLIKAPTLITDDGIAISESLLIIQHFEDVAGRSLRPLEGVARRRDLALTGIGIVAADKAVSIEYERKRPEAQRYAPWQERIVSQLHVALDLLDAAAKEGELTAGPELLPSDVAAAIAWGFCRFVIPEFAPEERWPALADQARACEALDVFKAWPIDRE
ncbi:glutathione S-transferase [Bosea sp. BE271]|uniref:glutathione S-transferase family protein n=1 Tax=Bosea TaxID=85413 RepID=UPI00285FD112|nr:MULTISPECIES: glutathione S-transferase family protein [Bosea]MDR6828132.1 glutathione S-transferase [Bosea robiniae]MDR6894718.1 glutathione S-transferase [Bosea sp. BE109]MDR7138238.1 glutathione S-transferase [Bosea sp. BE168]MDR7174937.1 glutathione S-transferase [Bosea sp. BE271]